MFASWWTKCCLLQIPSRRSAVYWGFRFCVVQWITLQSTSVRSSTSWDWLVVLTQSIVIECKPMQRLALVNSDSVVLWGLVSEWFAQPRDWIGWKISQTAKEPAACIRSEMRSKGLTFNLHAACIWSMGSIVSVHRSMSQSCQHFWGWTRQSKISYTSCGTPGWDISMPVCWKRGACEGTWDAAKKTFHSSCIQKDQV